MGSIEVICGSMFSGKTEELIRRLKRLSYANKTFKVFKPEIDTRNKKNSIQTHSKIEIEAQTVNMAAEILKHKENFDVIGIDEAQFFDDGIIEVANALANQGKRVVIAGLDKDFKGRPFGPMPNLLATAEYVTKLHAICRRTGGPAHFSHRIVEGDQTFLLGEQGEYEPVSRVVYNELNKTKSGH